MLIIRLIQLFLIILCKDNIIRRQYKIKQSFLLRKHHFSLVIQEKKRIFATNDIRIIDIIYMIHFF